MALLVRPEPFTSDFDRVFDAFFGNAGRTQRQWTPAMDLVDGGDHFLLEADLPGLGEDDVEINLQDGVLTISGERTSRHESRERGWHRVERSYGRFSRSLTLPDGIDQDAIQASFDRGVLTVRVPKPAERKPHRIAIGNSQPAIEGKAEEK